jgi:ABC-type multidrug transport system ATPase subunit
MSAPLWRLTDVTVPGRYGPRLDRLSLEISSGVTAVLGPSGAGKTTLLNLLVGFETSYTGAITSSLRGRHSPSAALPHSESAGYESRLPLFWVPPGHGLWPHVTVRNHLASILPTSLGAGLPAPPLTVEQLLEQFDLRPLAAADPGTLSQGERDRLSLARAIASGASVLVLDEPLAHLPPDAAARYWTVLRTACEERQTSLVMATHDPGVASREAGRIIRLESGRVLESRL